MAIGILLILGIIAASGSAASIRRENNNSPDLCISQIYCQGDLLKTVQLAEIFNDSKTFVDSYQKNDPQITLANFKKLMEETNNQPNRSQVAQFVLDNFSTQDELDNYTLPDWQENPPFLKTIEDPNLQKWAKELNEIWKKLARKIKPIVAKHPDRHSLIYVDNAFVVPGGRFKEFYYWDSYWVIEGLLICGMKDTARGMINNFLSMVEKFGFIPNGGRIYYLMRSHPPLLIPMVKLYLEYTQDYEYLNDIIGTLEKEFDYWMKYKMTNVKKNGKIYNMAHYNVHSKGPRPESYKEDYKLAQKLSDVDKQRTLYNNLKAGAESGWDFSGRWFIGPDGKESNNLIDINTKNIIPVDLNSFLQRNAHILVEFHIKMNNVEKMSYYLKIAEQFQEGINEVLWNDEFKIWMDYNMKNHRHRTSFYPTNLTPLYTLSYNTSNAREVALSAISYLKKMKINSYFGGTPTSLNQTGEQWDFPNAWPPLQSIIIQGLHQTNVKEAVELSLDFALEWLESNYIGYEATGKMFEKYDATSPGKGGGGGEYNVQEGFGWTNGIVLEFIKTFYQIKLNNSVSNNNPNDLNNNVE
ncbi:trehalase-like [Vespa mandarinia]|uniref:trehalase-like n=1 Tax=Vespa mandarinia TaxID=7446 RepID=UPI0016193194|nr:trehalase-like [Vespa mandarinia]XP_035725472.1 trehalase-like [Vespa mandarinia]